ncbi:hypothetical protein H2203_000192 [Taxawa tesnikishii (nom. ined.)]|nr:hypothetical protein H2203_000192 [Dothideales sp. JES 119]
MPFRPERSLLKIEVDNVKTIDTRSVESLMGMWSLFSKVSDAMEDGKRLENLSWRLWNRETFAAAPRPKHAPLSTSLDSVSSDELDDAAASPKHVIRPELRRSDSSDSRSRGREKHITPIDLTKIVISIKEKKSLEPLAPLPLPELREEGATPETHDSEPTTQTSTLLNKPLESSASTVRTVESDASEPAATSDSSSTEMSSHSVIRGFQPGGKPSSYRSQTHLPAAQPTPILKTSLQYAQPSQKKKAAMFTLGSSSGEEESSLESHMLRNSVSSLTQQMNKPLNKKTTSFKEEIATRLVEDSPVFESDEEEDEEVSESVIEDDEDSSDWEDDVAESGQSSINDENLFKRVDSRPNLTSRRSLLTSLMHEPDRAKALANAASRSSPALRRSRTTSPNGPSLASSPQPQIQGIAQALNQEQSRSKPIIMTTSNTHQLALSPRTTRRNMLSTELTESLRRNLLWERQHKSSQNIAALKRRHTSHDVKNLKQFPEPQPNLSKDDNGAKPFSNDYFHAGLQEYHAKGW